VYGLYRGGVTLFYALLLVSKMASAGGLERAC
jgi:hypothetical protein